MDIIPNNIIDKFYVRIKSQLDNPVGVNRELNRIKKINGGIIPEKIEKLINGKMEKTFTKVKEEMLERFNDLKKKLSKSTKIDTLIMLDILSFTFEFKDEYYYVTYDNDSLCMVINDGQSFNEHNATEIGFYELEKYL